MKDVDFIIIFGCHIKKILNKRLDYFLKNEKNYKYKKIVLSGGIGRFGNYNEARYMKEYLLKNNISEDKIIIEDKSVSTKENVLFIIDLLKLKEIDKEIKVVLMTNVLHMYRIKRRFNKSLNNKNVIFEHNIVK